MNWFAISTFTNKYRTEQTHKHLQSIYKSICNSKLTQPQFQTTSKNHLESLIKVIKNAILWEIQDYKKKSNRVNALQEQNNKLCKKNIGKEKELEYSKAKINEIKIQIKVKQKILNKYCIQKKHKKHQKQLDMESKIVNQNFFPLNQHPNQGKQQLIELILHKAEMSEQKSRQIVQKLLEIQKLRHQKQLRQEQLKLVKFTEGQFKCDSKYVYLDDLQKQCQKNGIKVSKFSKVKRSEQKNQSQLVNYLKQPYWKRKKQKEKQLKINNYEQLDLPQSDEISSYKYQSSQNYQDNHKQSKEYEVISLYQTSEDHKSSSRVNSTFRNQSKTISKISKIQQKEIFGIESKRFEDYNFDEQDVKIFSCDLEEEDYEISYSKSKSDIFRKHGPEIILQQEEEQNVERIEELEKITFGIQKKFVPEKKLQESSSISFDLSENITLRQFNKPFPEASNIQVIKQETYTSKQVQLDHKQQKQIKRVSQKSRNKESVLQTFMEIKSLGGSRCSSQEMRNKFSNSSNFVRCLSLEQFSRYSPDSSYNKKKNQSLGFPKQLLGKQFLRNYKDESLKRSKKIESSRKKENKGTKLSQFRQQNMKIKLSNKIEKSRNINIQQNLKEDEDQQMCNQFLMKFSYVQTKSINEMK